jgi:hypothetical protein
VDDSVEFAVVDDVFDFAADEVVVEDLCAFAVEVVVDLGSTTLPGGCSAQAARAVAARRRPQAMTAERRNLLNVGGM